MKLKLSEVRTLYAALSSLDRYQKTTKASDDAPEQQIVAIYEWKPDTRWTIYANIRFLQPAIDQYEEVRKATVRQFSGGKERISKQAAPKAFEDCLAEVVKLEEREVEVKQTKLSRKELQSQPVPFDVMTVLEPILEK